jgi:hypothetical protein
MHRRILIARNIVIGAGIVQLILGVPRWVDMGKCQIPVHVVMGGVLAVALFTLGVFALRAPLRRWLAILVLVWAIVMPAFGGSHTLLLRGSAHWTIEVAHLLLGVGAMALAGVVAEEVRSGPAKITSDDHDTAAR